MNPLFACSKCLKRGNYEEIFGGVGQSSSAEQLCKVINIISFKNFTKIFIFLKIYY